MRFQTKKWAERNGKRLLKKMKGKGWRLELHENMGWHFRVERKFPLGYSIKVYQCDDMRRGRGMCLVDRYWCLFGDIGGLAVWSTDTHSKNPNLSVRKQLKACLAYSNHIASNVADLENLVKQMT